MKDKTKTKIIIVELLIVVILIVSVLSNTYILFYLIISDSMNPTIYKDDIVLVKKGNNNFGELKNKIIAFYNPIKSKIIVHRVNGEKDGYLLTKGDNSAWVDSYVVPRGRVVGEVVFIVRSSKIFK